MSSYDLRGRKVVIATMHKKEQVIAPMLERELGLEPISLTDFDTDKFGTFSGEIERTKDPLETARMKCRAAGEHYGCSLAVASEGSFGPHPSMFFAPADDEFILLLDLEHGLEFKARVLSTETNFGGAFYSSWREVEQFARTARFPSHGLILRDAQNSTEALVKGIDTWERLEKETEKMLGKYGQVFAETDMRAMFNPTRMKIIEQATFKLVESIKRTCPKCQVPGFDVTSARPGLPCEICGAPTRSTQAHIISCQRCSYYEIKEYPHNKTHESATHCDWCNP